MARAHEPLANRDLAAFTLRPPERAPAAEDAAYAALLEALARLFAALEDPGCARLLGPVVPGATMPRGARVPGTSYELDPVAAAFAIGVATGWDAPAAAEAAGAANLGALFAVLDHRSRRAYDRAEPPPCVADLLAALERAGRIQSVLEREPDYAAAAGGAPLAVRVASAALAARLLGGGAAQIAAAATQAWLDGGAAPSHPRAAPCASRARWAAADATSRGLRLALLALAADRSADGAQAACDEPPAVEPRAQAFAAAAHAAAPPPADLARALERFAASLEPRFGARRARAIRARAADRAALVAMPVHEFTALLVCNA